MFKELEAIKARVKEMEEEAEKLKEMQKQVEETIMSPPASQPACKMKHCCYFYRNSNLNNCITCCDIKSIRVRT